MHLSLLDLWCALNNKDLEPGRVHDNPMAGLGIIASRINKSRSAMSFLVIAVAAAAGGGGVAWLDALLKFVCQEF